MVFFHNFFQNCYCVLKFKRKEDLFFFPLTNKGLLGLTLSFVLHFIGTSGDTGELRLKESDTGKAKFERDGTDVFTFNDKLSIGEIQKLRIWHDNKGFSSGISSFTT